MDKYITIFDMPNWHVIGISMIQAVVLYLLVLTGLKLAGRRMFAEMNAQDFVVLLLVSDAANLGLTHNDGGFWSSVFSVIAVIAVGSVLEYVPVLHNLVEGKTVVLCMQGRLDEKKMREYHISVDDLDATARQYGLASHKDFVKVILEADGSLTGVVRSATHRGQKV